MPTRPDARRRHIRRRPPDCRCAARLFESDRARFPQNRQKGGFHRLFEQLKNLLRQIFHSRFSPRVTVLV